MTNQHCVDLTLVTLFHFYTSVTPVPERDELESTRTALQINGKQKRTPSVLFFIFNILSANCDPFYDMTVERNRWKSAEMQPHTLCASEN
jgi:hypothetical protein